MALPLDVKVDLSGAADCPAALPPKYDEEAAVLAPAPVIAHTVVYVRQRPIFATFLLIAWLYVLSWSLQYNPFVYYVQTAGCLVPFSPPETNGMFREQRNKVLSQFRASSQYKPSEWILALGNEQEERTNADTDILFRQDSNFLYLTGYNIPDVSYLINIDSGYSVMFLRPKSRSEIIFDGGADDFEQIKYMTDSDDVFYDNEIGDVLSGQRVEKIHVISSSAVLTRFPELSGYTLDSGRLLSYLFYVRQTKTETEIEMLRIASNVTSRSHESIMRAVRPSGWLESDLESLFLYECYNCGLRFQAYIGIFGTGKNGAVLHYIKNDSPIKDGDMILVDAAGEYHGYASDVTRTFPANGVFTTSQRAIYLTVLNAQKAAIEACKPGVSWGTITSIANRKLVEGLVNANVLVGDVDDLLSAGVLSTFYPHGLGHPVGLDVHDPTPSPWVLAYNQVFTIEPGIYFVDMLIDEARENPRTAQYYNFDVIDTYLNFGGIEDCIRITETSYEVISDTPKEIDDVERWMAGY